MRPAAEAHSRATSCRKVCSEASEARVASTASPWHFARQTHSSKVSPRSAISSRSTQQSSIFASYHRHGPFHSSPGSTSSALRAVTSVPSPQKAGSDCVSKTSASAKKVSIEPREIAALASVRPSAELRAIAGGGSGRRCQPATGGVGLLGDSLAA
eukprot:scaffold110058_cov75-Phaeocystis_antarctica.AAC.1